MGIFAGQARKKSNKNNATESEKQSQTIPLRQAPEMKGISPFRRKSTR